LGINKDISDSVNVSFTVLWILYEKKFEEN